METWHSSAPPESCGSHIRLRGSVGSPDPTPASEAEGQVISLTATATATTAATNGQRQPWTASYSRTFRLGLGIRST